MTFRDFVKDQVGRLKAFAEFVQKVPEEGQKEIHRWIEDRSQCDPKAKSESVLSWLQNDEAARRVKSLIDECLTFDSLPDLRTMRAVWDRLYPPDSRRRIGCPHCHGDGFISVDGPFGLSSAQPCDHSGRLNPQLGVRMTPAQAKRYSAEEREAQQRHLAWLQQRAGKHDKQFGRVTLEDVQRAAAQYGVTL